MFNTYVEWDFGEHIQQIHIFIELFLEAEPASYCFQGPLMATWQ